MTSEQEMTLSEWCNRLPDFHLVNEQRRQVANAIALLSSMIHGGESHSETSRLAVNEALDNLLGSENEDG